MSGIIADNAGRSSGIVKAASGGGVSWQSVVTASTLTAVAGNGYPINTTSNACTVTLPASPSVGDEIIFTDYARTWGTNAVTFNLNSLKYQGNTTPQPVYDTAGESIRIVYVDATQGWVPTSDGAVVHETPQTLDIEHLSVGGGGGGGYNSYGGGGGAGGYVTNYGGTAITINKGATYTIQVGTGGAGSTSAPAVGDDGEDTVISGTGLTTITATGGGGGGSGSADGGSAGGSGGGARGSSAPGGAGNVGGPSGSPSIVQGYAGGDCTTSHFGAGGGGASEVGEAGSSYPQGGHNWGDGGNGNANDITGSSVTYAGGGGGGYWHYLPSGGTGGGGNGGRGDNNTDSQDGTDGLGGGGGGSGGGPTYTDGADGGSGIVILRMSDADAAGATLVNEDSTATDVGGSGETVITWLVDGSFTAAG
jgi:hypothetical protein